MSSLALYLHIPFCRQRCHYCDFNTFTGQEARQEDYVRALCNEIDVWGSAVRARDQSFQRPETRSIFFGGGTPSLLTSEQIFRILQSCRTAFSVQDDAEITMEANPGTVDRTLLEEYRHAGVNRISFGVQTFDNSLLLSIGREHDADAARDAVSLARQAGFGEINVDLIYGLPGQDIAGWTDALTEATKLDVEHISTYGLTIEPNTRFGRDQAAGKISHIDPDLAADMYEQSDFILENAGYGRYEIANFARPGHECRHNLTYWKNLPFLGLGAGAHSSTTVARFADLRPLGSYIRSARDWDEVGFDSDLIPAKSGPIDWVEELPDATQLGETMMLGLRLAGGIDLAEYQSRHNVNPLDHWKDDVDQLVSYGLLDITSTHMRLTPRGKLLGDEVFGRFLLEP